MPLIERDPGKAKQSKATLENWLNVMKTKNGYIDVNKSM